MSDEPSSISAPAVATGKALTLRALLTGLAAVVLFAIITPINDWLLHNTFLYSQHLPVGVFLLVVIMGVVVNPLLGRYRYRAGEMMVIIAMLLILGGVASSGLNRVFTAIMAGPAKIMPTTTELSSFVGDDGKVALPHGPYVGMPAEGLPDVNDPEYRYVIDGFHQGLGTEHPSVSHRATLSWSGADGVSHTAVALAGGVGGGDEVLDLGSPLGRAMLGQSAGSVITGPDGGEITITAVSAPGIPWGVWFKAFLYWVPLLGSAMICFLAIAAMVRHQWVHNERLTYPIANVIVGYLQDPEPGQRFSPIFRSKVFWIAFGIVAFVLLSDALRKMGVIPVGIPTELSLWGSFNSAPFNLGFATWAYMSPKIYFSIIGLVFFLPADISFSVWFCFVFGNVVYAFLRQQGVALDGDMPSKASMGGWFIECLLILWVGRNYYFKLIKVALARSQEPAVQEMKPFVWAFLAGAVGLVLAMTALGAQFSAACIAALCYLGIGLVLARLVAEAGIPFLQTPISWSVNGLIFSLTGFAAPMAALVPLTMLGQTLCSDPREHLLPFATNAEYLGERAGVKRLPWTAISLVVLAIGTVIAGATMLWCAYDNQGHQALDGWWRPGPFMGSLGPIATHAEGGTAVSESTWWCYGLGGLVTGGLGVARLAFAWWPIHPIGFLVFACYPTYQIWTSFFVGWLAKVLVMRYGGMQLYKRMKPAAMGFIASEAVVAGAFLVIALIAGLVFDHKFQVQPRFLPG